MARQPVAAKSAAPPTRTRPKAEHAAPARFQPGRALELDLRTTAESARVHYRHVNQGERWVAAAMHSSPGGFHGAIPAEYTDSPFPLEYYFELDQSVFPGFDENFLRAPYYVVERNS